MARAEHRSTGGRRPARVARLLVIEMVVWPGILFVSGTLFIAYQVRATPAVWPALLAATGISVAVGIRQVGTMLRAAASSRGWTFPDSTSAGEDSPRPTGRGTTED